MALEIPSLGRPFTLGMLYDCREEKLIPGITLWNREDLERNITTTPQNNTDFEVLTSDSVSDKLSALNVSGALKLSLLSGMIDVEGSGKYLTDTKESKGQARVTLKYRRTTRFEQLSMDHLSLKNITHPEVGIATHMVTGILYGAQAFFVFDKKDTTSNNISEVQGQIQGIVTKKGGEFTGDTEKEFARQLTCTFHGDFALEKNPVTYEEAVEVYASLPKLIGENGERAVPIKVWLYPLKHLDSSAVQLIREIRDPLLFRAEEIIQQMAEDIMECNDLMNHPAAPFPALGNKIKQFKKLYEDFRIMYQKQISQVLSSVRGGDKEESSLEETLTSKEKSPFSNQEIRKFLDRRWREMDLVHIVLQNLVMFKIIIEQRELRRVMLESEFDETICFNFSSLASEDSYLSHLESWLHKEPWDLQDDFSDDTKQWFEETEIQGRTKRLIRMFYKVAETYENTQFLVTFVLSTDRPGITFHYYKNGELVNTPESLQEILTQS